MRTGLRRARRLVAVALVPVAGVAFRADVPPQDAYVVIVAAPDLTQSADLAHMAADEIAAAIGPAWRSSLIIRAASSPADTAHLCRRMVTCEVVRVTQQPSPRNPEQSELALLTVTARGAYHVPADFTRACGIRPTLRAAYSRCRTRLAADIAQEIRAHDRAQHSSRRRRS